jgi:hypothetical protein
VKAQPKSPSSGESEMAAIDWLAIGPLQSHPAYCSKTDRIASVFLDEMMCRYRFTISSVVSARPSQRVGRARRRRSGSCGDRDAPW